MFERISEYLKRHQILSKYRRVISALSFVVAFVTVYVLVLPAITLTNEMYCGKQEHTHNDECYEQVLVCEDLEHSHEESCYENKLICIKKEHTHNELCYSESENYSFSRLVVDEFEENREIEYYTDWYQENVEELSEVSDYSSIFTRYCLSTNNSERDYSFLLQDTYSTLENLFTNNNRFLRATFDYEPEIGDLAFVIDEQDYSYYTGVITKVEEDSIEVIVGSNGENGLTLARKTIEKDNEELVMYYSYTQMIEEKEEDLPEDVVVSSVRVYQGEKEITELVNSLPAYRKPSFGLMALDLNDYIELGKDTDAGRIYDIVATYHPYHETGECEQQGWKVWDENITPDAHIRFNVKYADLKPELVQNALVQDGAYQLIYKTGEDFDNVKASGNVIVGDVIRGTVKANDDGDIILSIQKEWIDSLVEEGNTSITGDFYYQATFDLSKLEENEQHKIKFGDIEFDLPSFDNPTARYGDINIKKTMSDDIVEENGKYFLDYTITVTNGPDVMKDIEVKDVLSATNNILKDPNNKYYGVSYPTGTPSLINVSDVSTVHETINNDSEVEGQIYFNNNNLHTDHHENFTKYAPTSTGDLVYYVSRMEAYEVRTLTYRVEIDPKFVGVHHWNTEALNNDAYLFSKGYPHKSSSARYDKNATANVRKRSAKIEPVTDSLGEMTHYLITYEATVTTPSDNDYTMTNVLFEDSIRNNHTDFTKYGQYVQDSIKVDGVAVDNVHFDNSVTEGDYTYVPSFNFNLGDMAPNARKVVTYQILFEAGHEAEANEAVINNTAKVFNDNTKRPNEKPHNQLSYWDVSVNPSGQVWERKLGGNRTTLSQTITMNPNDPVYDPKQTDSSTGLYKEITNPGSFVVNSGSYEFTIIINEKGQWALEGLSLRDESDKDGTGKNYLLFNGYLRIDVYDNLGSNLESYKNTHANCSVPIKLDTNI